MDAATALRYQPPSGDIYITLQQQYGTASANNIAAAANQELADNNGEVAAAIAVAQFGQPLDASTTDAFINQIETNPLAAPITGLENQIKAAVQDFFSNPYVLVAAAGIVFFAIGGLDGIAKIRQKIKNL